MTKLLLRTIIIIFGILGCYKLAEIWSDFYKSELIISLSIFLLIYFASIILYLIEYVKRMDLSEQTIQYRDDVVPTLYDKIVTEEEIINARHGMIPEPPLINEDLRLRQIDHNNIVNDEQPTYKPKGAL